jgi:ubiquinone/menaquinone biosynthesis C-methylase UbiE
VADAIFEDPRLAELYDPLDADRSDLDVYTAMASEVGAMTVLDIGCGTGTLACLLAQTGLTVTAIDPAAASLTVAQRKPSAGRVRWLHGDATALPALQMDLVTVTGNVAQVFVTDQEWSAALSAIHKALRAGGRLVFESRDVSLSTSPALAHHGRSRHSSGEQPFRSLQPSCSASATMMPSGPRT